MSTRYPKIAQLKTADGLRQRLAELKIDFPMDDTVCSATDDSPLAKPLPVADFTVGNRWCIHPMEGWDANRDGSPSELTIRRWQRFGISGAKWIWGGEAAAVRPDGRANPQQTMAIASNRTGLKLLLDTLKENHKKHFDTIDDLYVGLQLTHSGRFCRPNGSQLEPKIAYHHPILDQKFKISPTDDSVVWTDDELDELIEAYVTAARLAHEVGFQFVDVKACHGYLLHEFLSARSRPGKYGGDLMGRTNVLRTIIQKIHETIPGLHVAVRVSIFDLPPFQQGASAGEPMQLAEGGEYHFGFGCNPANPTELDLTEPLELIGLLKNLGVVAVNLTCGSPYYNPHIQRPAIFPPSDGYLPPEDPLVGVARHINVGAQCKAAFPDLPIVGSGYTYLQDFLPQVAQAVVRKGWIDAVGIGRMVLSYPEMPADSLAGRSSQRKLVCRTFSDCTTAPRNGMVSGCYPLDSYYKSRPENERLKELKSGTE